MRPAAQQESTRHPITQPLVQEQCTRLSGLEVLGRRKRTSRRPTLMEVINLATQCLSAATETRWLLELHLKKVAQQESTRYPTTQRRSQEQCTRLSALESLGRNKLTSRRPLVHPLDLAGQFFSAATETRLLEEPSSIPAARQASTRHQITQP